MNIKKAKRIIDSLGYNTESVYQFKDKGTGDISYMKWTGRHFKDGDLIWVDTDKQGNILTGKDVAVVMELFEVSPVIKIEDSSDVADYSDDDLLDELRDLGFGEVSPTQQKRYKELHDEWERRNSNKNIKDSISNDISFANKSLNALDLATNAKDFDKFYALTSMALRDLAKSLGYSIKGNKAIKGDVELDFRPSDDDALELFEKLYNQLKKESKKEDSSDKKETKLKFDLNAYKSNHNDKKQLAKITIKSGEEVQILEHPFKNQPHDSLIEYKGKQWLVKYDSLEQAKITDSKEIEPSPRKGNLKHGVPPFKKGTHSTGQSAYQRDTSNKGNMELVAYGGQYNQDDYIHIGIDSTLKVTSVFSKNGEYNFGFSKESLPKKGDVLTETQLKELVNIFKTCSFPSKGQNKVKDSVADLAVDTTLLDKHINSKNFKKAIQEYNKIIKEDPEAKEFLREYYSGDLDVIYKDRINDSSEVSIIENDDDSITYGTVSEDPEENDTVTFTKDGNKYTSPPKAVQMLGMKESFSSKEELMTYLDEYSESKGVKIKDAAKMFKFNSDEADKRKEFLKQLKDIEDLSNIEDFPEVDQGKDGVQVIGTSLALNTVNMLYHKIKDSIEVPFGERDHVLIKGSDKLFEVTSIAEEGVFVKGKTKLVQFESIIGYKDNGERVAAWSYIKDSKMSKGQITEALRGADIEFFWYNNNKNLTIACTLSELKDKLPEVKEFLSTVDNDPELTTGDKGSTLIIYKFPI